MSMLSVCIGGLSSAADEHAAQVQEALPASAETRHQQDTAGGG